MKVLSENQLKAKLAKKIAHKNNHEPVLSKRQETQSFSASQVCSALTPDQDSKKTIKKYLLSTLARREYSAAELRRKLLQKDFNLALSESVLQSFINEGLQSDQRFCEMFIRSRIAKCTGTFKIRMELNAKGVSTEVINKGFEAIESDWFVLALEAALKKTHSWKSFEFQDKAKLMRFLQGKGFDQEQIRYAVDTLWIRRSSASG